MANEQEKQGVLQRLDSNGELNTDIKIPDGLLYLVDGYLDYAKEVAVDRAIVEIDGLKKAQRRIMYTAHESKATKLVKSNKLANDTTNLHPHSADSVYKTLVKLVSKTNVMQTPLLDGKGDLGLLNTTEPPAAARYTEVKMSKFAEELFRELQGVLMVMSEDGKHTEPILLPVSFPLILCNVSTGIGVGLASELISYNFHDVLKIVKEFLQYGYVKSVLVPDFTSKGLIVNEPQVFEKLMETGRGKITLRGKWHIDGKQIIVTEFPYYTTVTSIKKKIDLADIQGVSSVNDSSDIEGNRLTITCRNKKVVEEVLNEVLRVSDLQMAHTVNSMVVVDNMPQLIGVNEIIAKWVDFRRGVLIKHYKAQLEAVVYKIPRYAILSDLIGTEEKRNKFIATLSDKSAEGGEQGGRKLLIEWYTSWGLTTEIINTILDMKLRSLSAVARVNNTLASLKAEKVELEGYLTDIDAVINRQMDELNVRYNLPRQTEITDVAYDFEATKPEKVKIEAVKVLATIQGKFIKKVRYNQLVEGALSRGEVQGEVCMSDDIMCLIDTQGRMIRVNLENIPFHSMNEIGLYIPVYAELEDDFDLVTSMLIQPKTVGYAYSDGYVSVVDYNEWVGNKRMTKVLLKGVSPLSRMIISEFSMDKEYLFVLTNKGRFCFKENNFRVGSRTSRTKLVDLGTDETVAVLLALDVEEAQALVSNTGTYADKLSYLKQGDNFNNDVYNKLLTGKSISEALTV